MPDHPEIPKGLYCYKLVQSKNPSETGLPEQIKCPHWKIDKDYDRQNNGFCALLNLGDWEDSGSMLWDQVKECNINMDDEDEIQT